MTVRAVGAKARRNKRETEFGLRSRDRDKIRSRSRTSSSHPSQFPTTMADVTQTDVSRPSALPTAKLRPSASQGAAQIDQSSAEYLDSVEEEWNKRVDAEVEVLVDGMVDLVGLASASNFIQYSFLRDLTMTHKIGEKDKFRIAQESFQSECRAESMVRQDLMIHTEISISS